MQCRPFKICNKSSLFTANISNMDVCAHSYINEENQKKNQKYVGSIIKSYNFASPLKKETILPM